MNISGQVALVTGGGGLLASAAVERLLGQGARVVVADLAPGRLEPLLATGREDLAFVRTDITEEDQVLRAVGQATEAGPLRLMLNCAGIGVVKRALAKDGTTHDLESFRRMLDVNVVGTFLFCVHAASAMSALPALEDGERGVVINTASVAGLEGSAGQLGYGASKAAVVGMTLPLARDLAPVGIRVLTIAPGGMAEPGTYEDTDDPRLRAVLANVPHPRRFGSPADFALLVSQLVEHPYLNAEVVRLDGGARLGLKH